MFAAIHFVPAGHAEIWSWRVLWKGDLSQIG